MGNQASADKSGGERLENDISLTWKRVADCSFPAREGQCSCSCGNKMFVFGGVIQSFTDDLIESNDLLCFEGATSTWRMIDVKGVIPAPRCAGSLVAVGNKLYLYGGLNQESGWLDSLHVFNTETNTWSTVECEGIRPSARDKLQATVVDQRIFYFGGFGPKCIDEDEWDDIEEEDEDEIGDAIIEEERTQQAAQFGWFNDLYVFDTATSKWSQPMHMNLGIPTARAAHGMCTVGRNILIFGGKDIDKRRDDLHMYNVDTRKWNMDMKCVGQAPVPRSFHTCTAVGHRMVVMGGRAIDNTHLADLHIFDTETFEWLQPKVGGDLPCGRGQQSVAGLDNQLVLYGGSSEFNADIMSCLKFHGDTFVLPTGDVLQGKSQVPHMKTNGHSNNNCSAAEASSSSSS